MHEQGLLGDALGAGAVDQAVAGTDVVDVAQYEVLQTTCAIPAVGHRGPLADVIVAGKCLADVAVRRQCVVVNQQQLDSGRVKAAAGQVPLAQAPGVFQGAGLVDGSAGKRGRYDDDTLYVCVLVEVIGLDGDPDLV